MWWWDLCPYSFIKRDCYREMMGEASVVGKTLNTLPVCRGQQLDLTVTDLTEKLTCRGSPRQVSHRKHGLVRSQPCKLWKGPLHSLAFRQRYICSSSSPLPPPSVVLMKLSRSCHSLTNGCASQHDGQRWAKGTQQNLKLQKCCINSFYPAVLRYGWDDIKREETRVCGIDAEWGIVSC